jgi:hypothetical protein
MKELYTKPEVKVDEYNNVDVLTLSTPNVDSANGEDD